MLKLCLLFSTTVYYSPQPTNSFNTISLFNRDSSDLFVEEGGVDNKAGMVTKQTSYLWSR